MQEKAVTLNLILGSVIKNSLGLIERWVFLDKFHE